MDDFDPAPSSEIPTRPVKGRGAAGNVDHRFTTETRQAVDDGWEQAEPSLPQTRLHTDSAKSIISHNDSPGLDFETQIFAKPDAPRRLREELAKPGYTCSTIALGTATDAYQPFERRERLTRAVVQVMLETKHPVSVVTKSSLIVRDIDLWAELASQRLGHVAISLTTLNGPLARQLEPRASAPHARLEAINKLTAAGIPVTVLVAPLIPGINDHELEKLLAAAKEHGANSARYTVMRLPHEVAPLFRDWLDWHAPEKAARVMSVLYDLRGQRANDPNFGSRMTGLGHYAELLRQRFALACRRLALSHEWPRLDTTRFVAPPAGDAPETRQLSLF